VVDDEKLLQGLVGFDILIPFAFPLFNDTVTMVTQGFDFLLGMFVHFVQSAIGMYGGVRVAVVLETFGTSMP